MRVGQLDTLHPVTFMSVKHQMLLLHHVHVFVTRIVMTGSKTQQVGHVENPFLTTSIILTAIIRISDTIVFNITIYLLFEVISHTPSISGTSGTRHTYKILLFQYIYILSLTKVSPSFSPAEWSDECQWLLKQTLGANLVCVFVGWRMVCPRCVGLIATRRWKKRQWTVADDPAHCQCWLCFVDIASTTLV